MCRIFDGIVRHTCSQRWHVTAFVCDCLCVCIRVCMWVGGWVGVGVWVGARVGACMHADPEAIETIGCTARRVKCIHVPDYMVYLP